MPDRVKPSFVVIDIQTLALSPERQSAWMSKSINDGLTSLQVWHRILYSCTHMATVSVKGSIISAIK